MLEQADAKRSEAQAKLSEGALEEAISLFTQVIESISTISYSLCATCPMLYQTSKTKCRHS
jgi:hypothetical protein